MSMSYVGVTGPGKYIALCISENGYYVNNFEIPKDKFFKNVGLIEAYTIIDPKWYFENRVDPVARCMFVVVDNNINRAFFRMNFGFFKENQE